MAVAPGGLISLSTGRPVSLEDNLAALGYTQTTTTPSGSSESSTSSNQSMAGSGSSHQTVHTVNSTPQTIAALNALIATLQAGGTPTQQATANARLTEVSTARQLRQQFSPEAATMGGNALINKAISDALIQSLPSITAAAEGAGTSRGSMSALLRTNVATKAGTEGAALAANLSTAYGTLQVQLENTLQELTKQDPNSVEAQLAQVILGSKGLVVDSTTTGTSTQSQNQSGGQSTSTVQSGGNSTTTRAPIAAPQQYMYTAPPDAAATTEDTPGFISRRNLPPAYNEYQGGGSTLDTEGADAIFIPNDADLYNSQGLGDAP